MKEHDKSGNRRLNDARVLEMAADVLFVLECHGSCAKFNVMRFHVKNKGVAPVA